MTVIASLTWTPRSDPYAESSWPIEVTADAGDSRSLQYALADRIGLPADSIRLTHVVIYPQA